MKMKIEKTKITVSVLALCAALSSSAWAMEKRADIEDQIAPLYKRISLIDHDLKTVETKHIYHNENLQFLYPFINLSFIDESKKNELLRSNSNIKLKSDAIDCWNKYYKDYSESYLGRLYYTNIFNRFQDAERDLNDLNHYLKNYLVIEKNNLLGFIRAHQNAKYEEDEINNFQKNEKNKPEIRLNPSVIDPFNNTTAATSTVHSVTNVTSQPPSSDVFEDPIIKIIETISIGHIADNDLPQNIPHKTSEKNPINEKSDEEPVTSTTSVSPDIPSESSEQNNKIFDVIHKKQKAILKEELGDLKELHLVTEKLEEIEAERFEYIQAKKLYEHESSEIKNRFFAIIEDLQEIEKFKKKTTSELKNLHYKDLLNKNKYILFFTNMKNSLDAVCEYLNVYYKLYKKAWNNEFNEDERRILEIDLNLIIFNCKNAFELKQKCELEALDLMQLILLIEELKEWDSAAQLEYNYKARFISFKEMNKKKEADKLHRDMILSDINLKNKYDFDTAQHEDYSAYIEIKNYMRDLNLKHMREDCFKKKDIPSLPNSVNNQEIHIRNYEANNNYDWLNRAHDYLKNVVKLKLQLKNLEKMQNLKL